MAQDGFATRSGLNGSSTAVRCRTAGAVTATTGLPRLSCVQRSPVLASSTSARSSISARTSSRPGIAVSRPSSRPLRRLSRSSVACVDAPARSATLSSSSASRSSRPRLAPAAALGRRLHSLQREQRVDAAESRSGRWSPAGRAGSLCPSSVKRCRARSGPRAAAVAARCGIAGPSIRMTGPSLARCATPRAVMVNSGKPPGKNCRGRQAGTCPAAAPTLHAGNEIHVSISRT